jgi:hypothetical protein
MMDEMSNKIRDSKFKTYAVLFQKEMDMLKTKAFFRQDGFSKKS